MESQPAILTVPVIDALRAIVGRENIVHGEQELLVYECDAYTLEKQLPNVVVLPRTTAEVAAVVKLCAEHHLPIIPRGAGTSLSGTVLAVTGGVMIALTRMNRVLDVDYRNRRALVEAGCVNAWVTNAVKGGGLYYAPDPSSQSACTIGGNVATNSGGPHTLKYGVTTNHVLGFEMVMPDGEILWLGARPDGGEDVAGYDLRGVVVGCEGMFGIVTRVLLQLIRAPQMFKTLLGVFENVDDASRTVTGIIAAGMVPGAMEMMDQLITQAVEAAYKFGFPLDAGAVLIIELDGLAAGLDQQADRVIEICKRNRAREVRLAKTEQERLDLWKCRKRAFGAIGRLSPNFLTQDGVVPRSKLPEMMRFIRACSEKHGLRIPNVFHAGDGNIHPLILYDEREPAQVQSALAAGHDILEKCIEFGGSATGEHGIGVEKIDFMAKQFTVADLDAMRMLRRVFDPEIRCNPHKMFPGSKRCADFAPRKQIAA
ncbi:MAG TPA: FAD-linked oxidase C-terminal domain-containing protein [Verrucomicrobiae bacterium]|jgi:glycolate oxidase|nr:FAD-linked oxidase C-terminal domain-containing protein [Verrucomicrobiae bacterium]